MVDFFPMRRVVLPHHQASTACFSSVQSSWLMAARVVVHPVHQAQVARVAAVPMAVAVVVAEAVLQEAPGARAATAWC